MLHSDTVQSAQSASFHLGGKNPTSWERMARMLQGNRDAVLTNSLEQWCAEKHLRIHKPGSRLAPTPEDFTEQSQVPLLSGTKSDLRLRWARGFTRTGQLGWVWRKSRCLPSVVIWVTAGFLLVGGFLFFSPFCGNQLFTRRSPAFEINKPAQRASASMMFDANSSFLTCICKIYALIGWLDSCMINHKLQVCSY